LLLLTFMSSYLQFHFYSKFLKFLVKHNSNTSTIWNSHITLWKTQIDQQLKEMFRNIWMDGWIIQYFKLKKQVQSIDCSKSRYLELIIKIYFKYFTNLFLSYIYGDFFIISYIDFSFSKKPNNIKITHFKFFYWDSNKSKFLHSSKVYV
jgi:hypothetical protein